MSECSTNRFFGPVQTHIKMYQGSFVSVEGPNMTHKMNTLPGMKFPYQQILSSRITLRAGQTNYLLNHLGLGDNATFLAITALYDEKSKFESDNYVQYSFYSNKGRMFTFAQMLVLTGNSENRIEQLYLHNPNQHSAVILEVMVATIDDYYDYFTQNEGTSSGVDALITELTANDVQFEDDGEVLRLIVKKNGNTVLYLNRSDVNSITLHGNKLIIDDVADGDITLEFTDIIEASDAMIKIEDWLNDLRIDIFEPIIYFTDNVFSKNPPSNGTYSSKEDGPNFVSSSLNLGDYCTSSGGAISCIIDKEEIYDHLVLDILDFGGTVSISGTPSSSLIIKDDNNATYSHIDEKGAYYIYFYDIKDDLENGVSKDVNVKINITNIN